MEKTLKQVESELLAELSESGTGKARELFLEWQSLRNDKIEKLLTCQYCKKDKPCNEAGYPEGCFHPLSGIINHD